MPPILRVALNQGQGYGWAATGLLRVEAAPSLPHGRLHLLPVPSSTVEPVSVVLGPNGTVGATRIGTEDDPSSLLALLQLRPAWWADALCQ